MALVQIARKLGLLCVTGAAAALVPAARAGDGCCDKPHCPPPYVHCEEGPPKLKFKKGCPKPVCDPCTLPHYGYYATCWHPWPFPPDWSHCHVPPPGALVPLPAGIGLMEPPVALPPYSAGNEGATPLPSPRKRESP